MISPERFDLNNKVIKDRLTARVGRPSSFMSYLGEYENAVNIILNSLLTSGSRVDIVAHPLLYLMRHSLELGYKANFEYFSQYSKRLTSNRINKSHNLQSLHNEFKAHVDLIIQRFTLNQETVEEFSTYFDSTAILVEELYAEEASTFRYVRNVKGIKIFQWDDTIDVGSLKGRYDKAIVMLTHTCDLFAPFTDYADLIEKAPHFNQGLGKVYHTFPSWQLEDMITIISDKYQLVDSLHWKDETGLDLTIVTVDKTCYFLPVAANK